MKVLCPRKALSPRQTGTAGLPRWEANTARDPENSEPKSSGLPGKEHGLHVLPQQRWEGPAASGPPGCVSSNTACLGLICNTEVSAHGGTVEEQEPVWRPGPRCPECRLWPQNKNSVGSFPKALQPPGQDDLLKARRADSWNSSQGAE